MLFACIELAINKTPITHRSKNNDIVQMMHVRPYTDLKYLLETKDDKKSISLGLFLDL